MSRLRDCLGSLVKGDSPRCGEMSKGSLEKGAGCEQREQTEGLKGIALFIQIPYAPKKSLRLALTRPTSLYKGGESLRLALMRPTSLYKGGESLRLALMRPTSLYKGGRIPPACGKSAAQPLRSDCAELQIKTSVRSCDKDRSCFERGKKIPDLSLIQTGGLL